MRVANRAAPGYTEVIVPIVATSNDPAPTSAASGRLFRGPMDHPKELYGCMVCVWRQRGACALMQMPDHPGYGMDYCDDWRLCPEKWPEYRKIHQSERTAK